MFRETIETFKDNVSYLQKAITLNNSKYPVKATFSTPDELIGYTYDQYITYFYKWLELRLSYLEGMY